MQHSQQTSGMSVLQNQKGEEMSNLNDANEPEHPCPHCGREMVESIIADCSGGSHREVNGWYCEHCEYNEKGSE